MSWDQWRARFDQLPQLTDGESKDIRIIDDHHVMVKLKPSLYSYTQNRNMMIPGTDTARLRASEKLWSVLEDAGVKTNVVHVGDDYYVTERMQRDGQDYVPPIEMIVKARHVGTPKHSLYKIERHATRFGEPIAPNAPHAPYARFDYTNPLKDDAGTRLRDECIPTGLANQFIDATQAERTALKAFNALHHYLSARGIRLDDICFKIDGTGQMIFGEISPDCMRAVDMGQEPDFFDEHNTHHAGDVSKDTFRRGSSPEETLARYQRFVDLVEGPPLREPVMPKTLPESHGKSANQAVRS